MPGSGIGCDKLTEFCEFQAMPDLARSADDVTLSAGSEQVSTHRCLSSAAFILGYVWTGVNLPKALNLRHAVACYGDVTAVMW